MQLEQIDDKGVRYVIANFLRKRRWFIEALFNLQENATWERLIIFFLGLLLSGVWINYLYAILTITITQPAPPIFWVLVFSLVVVIIVELVARNYLHRKTLQYNVTDAEVAPARKWIITLISPWDGDNPKREKKITGPDFITDTNLENIAHLIRHHQEQIEKVFLIGTFDNPGVLRAFNFLTDELKNPMNTPILKNTQFDPSKLLEQVKLENIVQDLKYRRGEKDEPPATTADACFEAVAYIVKNHFQTSRISFSDVAVDITAGSKSMTMGLGLAALAYGLDH